MTVKFFNSSEGTGSPGGSVEIKQVTKLGVVAPHTTEIAIPFTSLFNKSPVEVLKMQGGAVGVVQTLSNFDNADSTDFEPNEFVRFDGVMKLETQYSQGMTDLGTLGVGKVFSSTVDAVKFNRTISQLEVK